MTHQTLHLIRDSHLSASLIIYERTRHEPEDHFPVHVACFHRAHARLGGRRGEARRCRFIPRGVPANKRSCVTPDEAALREMTQVESARYDRARCLPLKSSRRERQSPSFPGERTGCRPANEVALTVLVQHGSSRPGSQSLRRVHGRHPVTYSEKRASSENPSDDDASLDFARELR